MSWQPPRIDVDKGGRGFAARRSSNPLYPLTASAQKGKSMSETNQLRAGAAQVDITPPLGTGGRGSLLPVPRRCIRQVAATEVRRRMKLANRAPRGNNAPDYAQDGQQGVRVNSRIRIASGVGTSGCGGWLKRGNTVPIESGADRQRLSECCHDRHRSTRFSQARDNSANLKA